MKKVSILLSLFFCATFSFAQFQNSSTTGNANTLYHDRGGRTADQGFVITRFPDTAAANLSPIAGQPGGQIIVVNTVYIRDVTATKWIAISAGNNSTVSISADSSALYICNASSCDTFLFSSIAPIQNFTIVNDTTIVVCGVSSCDTLHTAPTIYNNNYYTKAQIDSILSNYYTQSQIDSINTLNGFSNQDGLISGGIVSWVSGLTFNFSASIFRKFGVIYHTNDTTITLDPPDPNYNRIDIFALDTINGGEALKITGIPSPTPVAPQPLDYQIARTSGFNINVGDTIPANVSIQKIYDENIEWATGTDRATVDFNNTIFPYTGGKDAFVSSYANIGRLVFTRSGTGVIDGSEVLRFRISLNSPLRTKKLSIAFFHGAGTILSSNIIGISSNNGLDPNKVNQYQSIAIPVSYFQWSDYSYNRIILYVSDYDTSFIVPFYLDDMELQTGVNNIPQQTDYSKKVDSVVTRNDSSFYVIGKNYYYFKTASTIDTTNKWVQNVYARGDSLFKLKNGIETFVQKASSIDTTNKWWPKTTDIDVLQAPDSSSFGIKKLDGTVKHVVIIGEDGASTGINGGSSTQVNSDWNATSGVAEILNKPTLFSGSYIDLTNKPILFSGSYTDLTNKPTLFSGSYTDLTNKPTIPAQFNPIAGTNMTITGTYPNITFNSTASGGGGTYTASNGLNMVGTDVELGGNLTSDVTISSSTSKTFYITNPFQFKHNGTGIDAISGNQVTVIATNGSNYGYMTTLPGTANDGQIASLGASNNSINSYYQVGKSGFTMRVGTDSLFKLTTVGALRLTKYGAGTFTGTPTYNLGVDASGNIIEVATGGGGTYTLPTASSTVLGGVKVGSGLAIDGNGVLSASGVIKQTYTSGSTVTVSNTTTWIIVNPATIQSALSIILPASPTDGQKVEISFGGTITSGNGVVTELTLNPNSGQTLIQSSTPSYMQSGDAISYRYNSSNSSWYRIN